DNTVKWVTVSKDKSQAVGMVLMKEVKPGLRYQNLKFKGLDPDKKYHVYNLPIDLDVRTFGSMINTMAPVHVKPGSLTESAVAKFVKLKSEVVDESVSGSVLMNAGLNLPAGFSGTGYNDKIRVMTDFASRLYIAEEI
ncbi:MAG: GH36 C-terminal domain-containing protein, partial [Candidatus Weimeria sp.]